MENRDGLSQRYEEARRQVNLAFARESSLSHKMQALVEILHHSLPHYSWVGIYIVEGADLVLGAWIGPEATEHVRIPIGQGVCGWAAERKETVVVADVGKDERYLMCFTNTKSEIVVPIVKDGVVYGEIDVDGDQTGAFGEEDVRFLEGVAESLADAFET